MNKQFQILQSTFASWITDDMDSEREYHQNEHHDIIEGFCDLYAVMQAFGYKNGMKFVDHAEQLYQQGKLKQSEGMLAAWCADGHYVLSGKYVNQL